MSPRRGTFDRVASRVSDLQVAEIAAAVRSRHDVIELPAIADAHQLAADAARARDELGVPGPQPLPTSGTATRAKLTHHRRGSGIAVRSTLGGGLVMNDRSGIGVGAGTLNVGTARSTGRPPTSYTVASV